jgi:hypothetical protein
MNAELVGGFWPVFVFFIIVGILGTPLLIICLGSKRPREGQVVLSKKLFLRGVRRAPLLDDDGREAWLAVYGTKSDPWREVYRWDCTDKFDREDFERRWYCYPGGLRAESSVEQQLNTAMNIDHEARRLGQPFVHGHKEEIVGGFWTSDDMAAIVFVAVVSLSSLKRL